MMNILSILNRLSCAALLGLTLFGSAIAQADTYEGTAGPDAAIRTIVPEGMDIVHFGDEKIDGWIPVRFDVSLPTDFQVTGVRFTLDIKPVGGNIETDTFHCLDDNDKWYTIFDNFEQYEAGKRVTIQFDVQDVSLIDAQLRAGILHCVLQDDSCLYGAKMQVFGNPASGGGTTTGPTFGVSDPNSVQWVVTGAWLSEAYYHGYITIGRVDPKPGQTGTWIYFRRVVSFDGYGVDPTGANQPAYVYTFGPEEWVYYP